MRNVGVKSDRMGETGRRPGGAVSAGACHSFAAAALCRRESLPRGIRLQPETDNVGTSSAGEPLRIRFDICDTEITCIHCA